MKKHLALVIVVLSLVGFGISIFSFAHNKAFVSGEFCSINESFNCDIVNKGPYSEIMGIPVALIGVIGYGLLGLAAYLHYRIPEDAGYLAFLVFSVAGGLIFSLYLTGIEAFVLDAWCLLCLTSQAVMLLITLTIGLLLTSSKSTSTPPVQK